MARGRVLVEGRGMKRKGEVFSGRGGEEERGRGMVSVERGV